MNKCLELIRVSTESQAGDERAGIPAQRAANLRTAAAYGLEIVRTFQIEDVSGAKVLQSPEIQEMLRLMQSPDIHGVICREFSRLMRPENFEDYALLQVFVETHTVLYLPDGPIDLSSKTGNLLGVLRAAMAGMERREILERMMDGKEALRRQGRHPGGSATLPFGVGYDQARGFFFTAEAEKIKRAYQMVLTSSEPYAVIAAKLNIPRTSLRVILQNPIYQGFRVYDQKRDRSSGGYIAGENGRQGYRRKVRREADEVIRLKVMEPLIPESIFDAVQEILKARAAREWTKRTENAPRYLFNGFLRCGTCEQPMYTRTDGSKADGRWYYCKSNSTRARQRAGGKCSSRYVMARRIEPRIEQLFSTRLQNQNLLRQIAVTLAKRPSAAKPEIDRAGVLHQVEHLTAKRSRILSCFFDGAIDRRTRDEQLARVDCDLSAYKAILSESGETPEPTIDLATLVSLFSVFAELPFLSRDDKRGLLRAAGAEVFVNGYTIHSVGMRNVTGIDSNTGNHLPAAASVTIPQYVRIPLNW